MKTLSVLLFTALLLLQSNIYSQTNQGKMTNKAIVEKFLDGFNNPEKIQESLALLADDYKFKNPMVELNSKAEFITLAQGISQVLTRVNILHTAENGEWVAVNYEFKSSLPGLESNMATEWFKLKDGIIQESHLIYDASEWRKVYAAMEK
ncbi:MAG: nuclear transport factor 2 family protein [Roseivirga sp.]|nr:nuclear transport factor 2 family protein [Roseivirga sp.]